MKLTDFQALSFDCYGTLIDWETGIAAVLESWVRERGLQVSDQDLLAAFGSLETKVEEEHPQDHYPQVLKRTMRLIGERFGATVTDDDAEMLARSVPDWPAFPDTPDALGRLASRFKLIILSNVDRASFAGSNKRLGVTFTSILTAQDIGSYKPSPRNFEALLAEAGRLGIPPDKLLHVAQSLFHDHVPAKRAGLRTAWIDRRQGKTDWGATPPPSATVTPDWTFPSLKAFADAVEEQAAS